MSDVLPNHVEDVEIARKEGFAEGYKKGHEDGRAEGYEDGCAVGRLAGYEDGYDAHGGH